MLDISDNSDIVTLDRNLVTVLVLIIAVSSLSSGLVYYGLGGGSSEEVTGPEACPDNYVWVPGSAKYDTNPGFCLMAYEAKESADTACEGEECPVSKPNGTPYASVTQMEAKNLCAQTEVKGAEGTHLITEEEWMTVATNIATTPINDVSPKPGIQLATGHSDIESFKPSPSRAVNSTMEDTPEVSGCNLDKPMWHEDNEYVEGSCEIRGNGVNSKGYTGTNDSFSGEYEPGEPGRSQMRTFVLSNGEVIWDVSGNVLEWTDHMSMPADQPVNSTGVNGFMEYSQISEFKSHGYAKPPYYMEENGSAVLMDSRNGTGKLYSVPNKEGLRGTLRGGFWADNERAGVFMLGLWDVPNNSGPPCGFRCSARPE